MVSSPTYGQLPGHGAIRETAEKVVVWEAGRLIWEDVLAIDSTAVDAGNTPTTTLRAGLLLGKRDSDSNLLQWNHDAVDGTERVHGVLLRDISMLDDAGVVEDKFGHVLLGSGVKVADLLIEGTAFTSSVAEFEARKQMTAGGRFIFDDRPFEGSGFGPSWAAVEEKTGSYVVVEADHGKLFIATTADATFTLPTIHPGLWFEFLRASDNEMVVASAAGADMIVGNDLSANSVTFTTAGEQIGARIRIEGIHVAGTSKWLVTLPTPPFGTGFTGGFTYGIAT